MIFPDNYAVVIDCDGNEVDMGEWSDELSDLARSCYGYIVRLDSDPAEILENWSFIPDARLIAEMSGG